MPRPVTRIGIEDLTAFCVEAMLRCGMREAQAQTTAEVLVTTDSWGVFTHGTRSLRQYLMRVRAGGLRADRDPEVIRQAPSWAVVDGGAVIGMVSACFAMDVAAGKAAETGIGFVTVRGGSHFGAAGYYAYQACRRGLLGLAMSNADPNMTVPGGRGKIIGNNPFAFAAPAGAERPILLDVALSAVAAGKLQAAIDLGHEIPDHWIVDERGLPTRDPRLFYAHRASLVPMAGHKGYGLALMVETLAAVLSGAKFLHQVSSWNLDDATRETGHGYAFLAMDPASILPIDEYRRRMDEVIRQVRQSPVAEGARRIYLPGEMEWERRDEAVANGIPLPADVGDSLRGLAADVGLEVPTALRA